MLEMKEQLAMNKPSTTPSPGSVSAPQSQSLAPQAPAFISSVSVPSLVLTALAVFVSVLALMVQRKNLDIQSQNQARQRRLEAFRAVHDFNDAYNKIVEFIPDDFKVGCHESQGGMTFVLEKLVRYESGKAKILDASKSSV